MSIYEQHCWNGNNPIGKPVTQDEKDNCQVRNDGRCKTTPSNCPDWCKKAKKKPPTVEQSGLVTGYVADKLKQLRLRYDEACRHDEHLKAIELNAQISILEGMFLRFRDFDAT